MPISRQPSRPHIVLDTIALYMARKAPPRKPNRGEGIVKGVASTKHEEAIALVFQQTRKLTRIMIAISLQSSGFHRSHSVCNTRLADLLAEMRLK